eukprot:6729136-Prymnesium_polylepis.2
MERGAVAEMQSSAAVGGAAASSTPPPEDKGRKKRKAAALRQQDHVSQVGRFSQVGVHGHARADGVG